MTTPDPLQAAIEAAADAYDERVNAAFGNPPGRVGVADGLANHPAFRAAIRAAAPIIAAQALRCMADEIDRGPTFPLPPSVISELVRERAATTEAATDGQ